MKEFGGKGRIGPWLLAYRNRSERAETYKNSKGSVWTLEAGIMLDASSPGVRLLSFGIQPGMTIGIGWVSKEQRVRDDALGG